MPYGLKGSYSVGGGKTKHVGSGSMKRPTSTTTSKPRSSYQAPSVIKPSSGVAQPKTTPIKGTPNVPTVPVTSRNITTTTTKNKGVRKAIKDIRSGAQSRQSMLDEIMKDM